MKTSPLTIVAMASPLTLLTEPVSASFYIWQSHGQPTPHEWNNSINWTGADPGFPGGTDDTALISSSGVYYPKLDSNYVIGTLTLEQAGVLWTGEGGNPGDLNFRLAVSAVGGNTGVTTVRDTGSRLDVLRSSNMNDLDTDDLIIGSGGTVRLLDGGIIQVDDFLDMQPGSTLWGNGAVEFTRDNGTNNPRNNGLIRAILGTMTFYGHDDAVFDLDGHTEAGALQVEDFSSLIFDMSVETGFAGTASIGFVSELHINSHWALSNGAALDFDGGYGTGAAVLSGSSTTFQGEVFVNSGEARLDVQASFGGNVTLADTTEMTLAVQAFIDQDASFTGNGSLVIDEGVLVEVVSGAQIDVPVHSDGRIVIDGLAANVIIFNALTLGPTAQCELGICNPVPGVGADQIQVTGHAALDGELELVQIQNCDPEPGDEFVVLTAASITGQFAQVTSFIDVEVIYGPTAVIVRIAGDCPADLDGDGAVNFNDLLSVLGAWGTPNSDIDGDGNTDFNDLLILLANWGTCV